MTDSQTDRKNGLKTDSASGLKLNQGHNKQDKLFIAIGSAGGFGLSPYMPGTCGAFTGVLLHVAVVSFMPSSLQWPCLFMLFALVCIANHALTDWAELFWQEKDPKHFVLDEVAGYLVVPILFSGGALFKTVFWGFTLFRIFDIFKLIPPARWVDENIHGPWGILLDDLVSAGYAVIIMYGMLWFRPEWLI